VYAVEDTTVQLSWADLGPGAHRLSVGGRAVEHEGAGAGTVVIDGLAPASTHAVAVDGREAGTATTLAAPPGELVAKIATVSDCHIFEEGFGAFRKQVEPDHLVHYSVRCLRAALSAAVAWGAELIVVKGDLTQRALPEELATATELLAACGLPVIAVPGNHEVKKDTDPWTPTLRAAGFAVGDRASGDGIVVRDLPALRVVAADTTIHGHHAGTLAADVRSGILGAVADADRPVLLCVHHQLEPWRVRLHYPPGVSNREATGFLAELAAARPDVWITSGHTHRCRMRRHGSIVATEVGSTKDGAGCWAGYAVHEGGLRQVLRRVTGDATDPWLDRTRRALGGLWGFYAPGRLEDRCLSHTWLTPA
jgi:Icc protein